LDQRNDNELDDESLPLGPHGEKVVELVIGFNGVVVVRRLRRHESHLRWRDYHGVLVVLLVLVFTGCAPDVSPFTTASFKVLPPEGTRVIVWGAAEAPVSAAEQWLGDRGLVVVDRHKVDVQPCRNDCPDEAGLKLGKAVNADQVVFLRISTEQDPKRVDASIRSVSAATGEELWQAVASQTLPPQAPEEEVAVERIKVVCHALATAWGFRGGGYARDSSLDVCNLKAPRP
jgi:hypothetical protein